MNTEYFENKDRHGQITFPGYCSRFTSGKCAVGFTDFGANYSVIDTDYTSYAVVYSCTEFFAGAFSLLETVWVLTRDPIAEGTPDFTNMMNLVTPIIEAKVPYYSLDRLRTTKQGGSCEYLPEGVYDPKNRN